MTPSAPRSNWSPTPPAVPTSASIMLSPAAAPADDWPALRARRRRWAELLRRVFDIEVSVCPACAGAMRIIAFVTAQQAVRRILAHLERNGIDARAGPWADAAA